MKNEIVKILIIEDNIGDARLALEYLKEAGFNENLVDHVIDLKSAEEIFNKKKHDVIFLDLGLPDSTRDETVNNTKKFADDVPIIVLSGNRDEVIEIESLESGVQEYLVKGDHTSLEMERGIRNSIIRTKIERELKQLNKFKDEILSLLSHDLRSPFNALISYIDFAREDIEDGEITKAIEDLNSLKEISLNYLNFVDNLLEWSRLQNDKLVVKPQKFSLGELRKKSLPMVEVLAHEKNIKLNTQALDETEVLADIDMIDTVIRNLTTNAVKFSYPNSEIDLVVNLNSMINIQIIDRGIGISETKLKELFNASKDSVQRGTNDEKGHGLGLLICKEFVEKNGGKLLVESKPNIGTKFIVALPKAENANVEEESL